MIDQLLTAVENFSCYWGTCCITSVMDFCQTYCDKYDSEFEKLVLAVYSTHCPDQSGLNSEPHKHRTGV